MSETTDEQQKALRELDAEVATELMGWQWTIRTHPDCGDISVQVFASPAYASACRGLGNVLTPLATADAPPLADLWRYADFRRVPRYSADIAAAWEVEGEIEKRGLGADHVERLTELVWAEIFEASSPLSREARARFYENTPGETFRLLRASPELRCRAALACVRAAKETA